MCEGCSSGKCDKDEMYLRLLRKIGLLELGVDEMSKALVYIQEQTGLRYVQKKWNENLEDEVTK